MSTVKPEGFHEHHRRKGDRQKEDLRGCDVIYVSPLLHEWIEAHPEDARKYGLSVSRYEDPADVPIVIPSTVVMEAEKKPREKHEKLPPKERVTTAIRTPKGEVNVIPELVEANREKHGPSMGWNPDVPSFFIHVLALVKLLELEPGDEQLGSEG